MPIQLKPGFCVECGCTRLIANRHYMLCIPHNQQRLNNQEKRPDPVKGPRTPSKPISRLRKATGEKAVFEEIAKERPHICFVTGTPIRELTVSCFAHVLNKNSFKRYRLNKENIVLVHPWVHECYDKGPRAKLQPYPGYKKLLDLHDRLLAQYHNQS